MTMLLEPSRLHLLEDLLLGALADGEHGDHRRDAEENPERRQAGAQFVVRHRAHGNAHAEQHVRNDLPA